jgi:hypothetical protein
VIVDGVNVAVPGGVGIAEPVLTPSGDLESAIGAISPLHTHQADGILHVEADSSPLVQTLGQFFDEWQVRLTTSCLGSYCNGSGSTLRVYLDGALASGDPASIVLSPGREIAVVYGPPGVPATVPSSYPWPPDLAPPGFGFPGI